MVGHYAGGLSLENLLPHAAWQDVDEYCDLLYEDNAELKKRAARSILRLCLDPQNLELLGGHESLMGVLSRELRENYKRSHEVASGICCVLLCFSVFNVFHAGALMQHQCGDVIMRILEYESKRYQVRSALERKPDEEKRYQHQLLRQNKLLCTCVQILLNLAEDVHIEKKMVNRQLVGYLCGLLDREMEELLGGALTFLKKLSVFEDNRDQMFRHDVVPKLVQLAHHHSAYIALSALRVLHNLSFGEQVASSLAENGELFKQLVDLLRHPPFRQTVLKLLYQFTRDDRCKSLLTYHPDCLVMLLQLIVHFPDVVVGGDLAALSINLALHPRAAELMVVCQLGGAEGPEFLWPQVVLRIIRSRDALLTRVLRHVTGHPQARQTMLRLLSSEHARMSRWLAELIRAADASGGQGEFLVEVVATLSNILPDAHLMGISVADLCEEAGLLELIRRILLAGFSDDDLVLECVILIGVIATLDDGAAGLLVCGGFGTEVVGRLQRLLSEKQDDGDMVAQTLYTLQCMLAVREGVEGVSIPVGEFLVSYVSDLMRHSSSVVRRQAGATLETIGKVQKLQGRAEDSWGLSGMRFEVHNGAWAAEIRRGRYGGMDVGYDVEDDPAHFDGAKGVQWDVEGLAVRDWGAMGGEL